jgi:tetratricopeptide repeat protein 8
MAAAAAASSSSVGCPPGVDPAYYALSLLRRRRLDACVDFSTSVLREKQQAAGGAVDLQLWWAKARALTNQSWFDDTEMEENDAGEVLVERAVTSSGLAPRPGTSLMGSSGKGGSGSASASSGAARPMSRASSGYARPSSRLGGPTGSRAGVTSSAGGLTGARPSTSRPITASGRFVRLGTASLSAMGADGGVFVDVEKLDCKKYAERATQARVLCDYLLYHEKHTRKAAELAAEATQASKFSDWWWKARLGKCYYYLNLARDAEQQFRSSLKHFESVATVLELGKVMMKLDQPLALIDLFQKGAEANPASTHLVIGSARLHDMLQNSERSLEYYRAALDMDGGHVEGLACLAAHYFHNDQPEIALRMYRRLLQMGVQTFELYNNLGLCLFYASQYDGALAYLGKALGAARNDGEASEVWYNISHAAVSLGDILMAYQALKVCISLNPKHSEALNNLGVLEMREERLEQARGDFTQAVALDESLHEAFYNSALLHWRLGEISDASKMCAKALDLYPDHWESLELRKEIQAKLTSA